MPNHTVNFTQTIKVAVILCKYTTPLPCYDKWILSKHTHGVMWTHLWSDGKEYPALVRQGLTEIWAAVTPETLCQLQLLSKVQRVKVVHHLGAVRLNQGQAESLALIKCAGKCVTHPKIKEFSCLAFIFYPFFFFALFSISLIVSLYPVSAVISSHVSAELLTLINLQHQ